MLVEALQGFTNSGNIVNEIERKRTKEKLYANIQGNPPANPYIRIYENYTIAISYLSTPNSPKNYIHLKNQQ